MNLRIRRISFIVLLCLIVFQAAAPSVYASEEYHFQMMQSPLAWPPPLECTSKYGPRNLNGHSFHAGIDMAAEQGEEVYAVADGIVVSAGVDGDNGRVVIIAHDKNWYSVYADLEETLDCAEGDSIKAGQTIGYVGWPAGSTGPHLHFAVRLAAPDAKGISPYLYAFYAPWLPQDCVSEEYMAKQSLTWNASFDFTGKVKETIDKIAEACTKAIGLLKGIILYIMGILMVIDLCITMFLSYLPGQNGGMVTNSILKVLTAKCLLYGFLFFAVTGWTGYLANTVRDYYVGMGAGASDVTMEAAKSIVADSFSLVGRGAKIVEPLFLCFGDMETGFSLDFLQAVVMGIPALFFFFVIFGCFVLLALQISLAYLEFYMVVVFSFSSFMFSGWAQTRRFAAAGLSGLFVSAVKLLFFTTFACLMTTMVNTVEIDNLITEKEVTMDVVYKHPDGNFKDIHELVNAIKTAGRCVRRKMGTGDGTAGSSHQCRRDVCGFKGTGAFG